MTEDRLFGLDQPSADAISSTASPLRHDPTGRCPHAPQAGQKRKAQPASASICKEIFGLEDVVGEVVVASYGSSFFSRISNRNLLRHNASDISVKRKQLHRAIARQRSRCDA
jgi:hypothetical protein